MCFAYDALRRYLEEADFNALKDRLYICEFDLKRADRLNTSIAYVMKCFEDGLDIPNMAKASLNMMTHSLASEYATDGILMYSVAPDWVSNQLIFCEEGAELDLDSKSKVLLDGFIRCEIIKKWKENEKRLI